MKQSRLTFCSILLLVLTTFCGTLRAQNSTLSVQGVIRKSDGSAVSDGIKPLTFTLWNAPAGGTLKHAEIINVQITGGIYSTLLGNGTTHLDAAFDETYYLGVQVDGGPELIPRAQLSAAPYTLAIKGLTNIFPSNGSVGIGITTVAADAKLQVNGNIRVKNDASIMGLDQLVGFNDLRLYGDATGGPDIYINHTGNVGIGTSAPVQKLEVNGGFKADHLSITNNNISFADRFLTLGSFNTSAGNPFGIFVTPQANNNGALGTLAIKWAQVVCEDLWYVDYHTISDQRVKENIQVLVNPIEKIKKLHGVQYDINTKTHPMYKNARPEDIEKSRNRLGFLAQELKVVFPEMVEYSKEEDFYSIVNMDQLIALLVEGIKEQQQTIELQAAKLDNILHALDKAGISVEN